jgi:hypothetical protein
MTSQLSATRESCKLLKLSDQIIFIAEAAQLCYCGPVDDSFSTTGFMRAHA